MFYENYAQFKSHAKALKKALAQGLSSEETPSKLRLSTVQEAIAHSLGYASLAAFKAKVFAKSSQIVDQIPDNLGPFLLCVEGLLYNEELEDESFAILNGEYATLRDLRHLSVFRRHRDFRSEGYCVGRYPHLDAEFWAQCYVTGIHIECPSVSEYGTPYFGDFESAAQRVADAFQMKVKKNLDIQIHDRGDDGGTTVFFEVHAPQVVFDKITALPLCSNDGEELES